MRSPKTNEDPALVYSRKIWEETTLLEFQKINLSILHVESESNDILEVTVADQDLGRGH